MNGAGAVEATTIDAFLGGAVEAVQPARGHHRSGLEAVLLAAALDRGTRGVAVDLGAGAGVAGLCLAARAPELRVLLVERDPSLLACATMALRRPANAGFAARVAAVELDVRASAADRCAAGIDPQTIDAVIVNPPFRLSGAARTSPVPGRAAAHVLGDAGIEPWLRTAAAIMRPGGVLVLIAAPPLLPGLLAAAGQRFGDIALLPIHPRAGDPAQRFLFRASKGRRGALTLLPGLILHEHEGGRFRPPVEAILRDGADLAAAVPAWQSVRRAPSLRRGTPAPIPNAGAVHGR